MTEPRDTNDENPAEAHGGDATAAPRPGAQATAPAAATAAPAPEEPGGDADGGEGGRRDGLLRRLEPAHWLWFAAAVVVVAALGFLAGAQWGTPVGGSRGGEGVNLAGAEPGHGPAAAAPVGGEGAGARYDAGIQGPRKGADLANPSGADLTALHRRDEHDPFALGPVDAPVVVSIFSDFECPFCARHAGDVERRIIADYVDAGLVRLEWNDAPLSGEHGVRAAEAGRAAAAQGRFWEYQDALFAAARGKGEGHPEFTDEELVAAAGDAGVPDLDRFRADLDDHVWAGAVHDAVRHAQTVGVSGTPAFVIGDRAVVGAQPYEAFREAIEVALFTAVHDL